MKLPEILNGSNMSFVRLLNASQVSVDLSLKSISSARIECRVEDAPVFGAWVKIYYPNGKFGVFRAGNPENDYSTGQSAVTLDHGTKTLSDNIVNVGDTYDDSGVAEPTYFEGTAAQVFAQLLSYQKTTFWRLGTVEVSDQIKIEVDFDNLLSKLNESLSQLEDCYFDYDQTSFPWTVNVRRIPTTVKAEGRLSRNISNVRIRYDDTDLCTRVYCESLDAGHLDSQYINVYGIREMRNQLTDVENADAVRICQRFLQIREKPRVGVTIDGGDFSALTGISLDRFVLGDLYRLVIPSRNIVLTDQITALNYPDIISSPYTVSITLGAERNDLSSALAQTKTKADTSSYSASKAGTNVMHVYEELKKEAIVTTNHGKVLRSAGIEFDENGVLLFAKEMGIDKGAGYVHAETGQTSVPMYSEESTSSAIKMRIPDGAQVVIKQRGETWSKVYYDRHEGYVLTDRIETRVNLSGAFNVTAERLTSDYTNAVANVESHLTQTASQILGVVDDNNENLSGRLSVMAREVELVTGQRYDDAHRKPYRNRNSFPAQGQAGYLYIDNSTKTYYVWENGAYVGTIDEPLVNAAGIVSSINNDGTSSTRILGTKVTVGNTVDTSTLPDWADATEGLIAQKATIVDLNAVRARVGTLETDYLKTSLLDSTLSNLDMAHMKSASITGALRVGSTIYLGSDPSDVSKSLVKSVYDLQITQSGNTYTLQKKAFNDSDWENVGTFSRATTLNGGWSGGRYTVTADPQGNTVSSEIHSIVVDEQIAPAGTAVRAYLKVHYATGNPSSPSADTGFTRQLVSLSGATVYSNGQSNGWGLAYGKLSWPSAIGSGTIKDNIVINHPTSSYNTSSNHTYYLYIDGDYACVKNAANAVVARINDAHGSQVNIQDTKTSTISGSYTITPDAGYDAMRRVEVTVNKGTRITLTRGTYHSQSGTYTYTVELTNQGSSATAYLQ